LQGYFLSAYSARKLGMQTTGNAGGCHNLIVHPGKRDLPACSRRWGAACWSPSCSVRASTT
jgi:PmbA protein